MSRGFTKNLYYNKTSVLKLIYFHDYLNKTSFLSDLVFKIERGEFTFSQRKSEVLSDIHFKLNPDFFKLELFFGSVLFFDDHLIFYFSLDWSFDEFHKFFSRLETDYKIKWFSIKVFDKNIKVIDTFSKTSLLRSYRDHSFKPNDKKIKSKSNSIVEVFCNCGGGDFLSFLKKCSAKNLKLVVYFHKVAF